MLVSVQSAARELGVSTRHVYRQIKKKRWPAYEVGLKALRVDIDEIRHLSRSTSDVSPKARGDR
jgi:excisionase family DNA binding protein